MNAIDCSKVFWLIPGVCASPGTQVGHILKAVVAATSTVQSLKSYFTSTLVPLLSASIAELSACRAGLAALIKAVEERVLHNLNNSMKQFFIQVRWESTNSTDVKSVFKQLQFAAPLVCMRSIMLCAAVSVQPHTLGCPGRSFTVLNSPGPRCETYRWRRLWPASSAEWNSDRMGV